MNHTKLMKQWEQRRERFRKLYSQGWTCRRIAEQEGLSVQRVHQIVKPKNPPNGGAK